MTKYIWTAEMMRLSVYLHDVFPDQIFILMADNFAGHEILKELPYQNLKIAFLRPNMTGYLQDNIHSYTFYKSRLTLTAEMGGHACPKSCPSPNPYPRFRNLPKSVPESVSEV